MSYETAPATEMLATQCACCARPLLDATSVETGVGPECRRKHGYESPQTEPDWDAATNALGEHLSDAYLAAEFRGDARAAANVLIHRVAAEQSGPVALACCTAIRLLGYVRIADRITERLAPVQIFVERDELVVHSPFSHDAVQAFRAVPGRQWDRVNKVNRFPASARAPLFAALQKAFPGAVAYGPKGLFTIPAA